MLPEITHLQYLILATLQDGELAGRALRTLLATAGHGMSGPAFYQLMARLEDAGLVQGRYRQTVVEGQALKERVYTITGQGSRVREETRNFYLLPTAHRPGLQGA
jgi:DNA-binding PadR family transcriptional regulator